MKGMKIDIKEVCGGDRQNVLNYVPVSKNGKPFQLVAVG